MAGKISNICSISRCYLDKYDVSLACGIITYFFVFSSVSLYLHSILSEKGNLYIFNQALWTTIHTGGLLENSFEGGSHFGVHFSPILLGLIPFYYLCPGPQVLLVFQSLFLGLGAIPVYLCGRDLLGKKPGLCMGFLYLLYPALHGVNVETFFEVAFAPFFLGMALWGLITDKKGICLIFCLLSILIKEDVALIVGLIGIIGLIKMRAIPIQKKWQYFILIFFSIVVMLSFFLIIKPLFCGGNNAAGLQFLSLYMDPISNLNNNNEERLLYLVQIFLPVLCIPLAAPEILLISVPSFLEILLSPYPIFFDISYHYSALIIPVLFMATISALEKIQKNQNPGLKKIFRPLMAFMLISSVISALLFSPLMGPVSILIDGPSDGFYEKKDELMKISRIIPEDVSVSTEPELLTLMSGRRDIWVDYNQSADIILIFPFFAGANYFNDDKANIVGNFDMITKNDSVYLFVNKNRSDVKEKMIASLDA